MSTLRLHSKEDPSLGNKRKAKQMSHGMAVGLSSLEYLAEIHSHKKMLPVTLNWIPTKEIAVEMGITGTRRKM